MFSLTQMVKIGRRVLLELRAMSSSSPLVNVEVDDEGIATMTMQRSPVNSLNLDLVQDMCKALDVVAKNKCKGMILTSSLSTIFCAGIDIMELYKPDETRLKTFRTGLQEVWIKLFGANFVTAAAINGHAPAAGCILAMSCEYRVMVRNKATIGVNDTPLGIAPPMWVVLTMANLMPQRQVELALTEGTMFSVDEALKVGLIDETATDKAECIHKCKNFIRKFDKITPFAHTTTKQRFRQAPLDWMKNNRETDLQETVTFLKTPNVQRSLEMYLDAMKQRRTK